MSDIVTIVLEQTTLLSSRRTLRWSVSNGAHATTGYAELRVRSLPCGLGAVPALGQLRALAHDEHVRACVNQPAHEPWWQCSDLLYHDCLISDAVETIETLRAHPGTALCVSLTHARILVVAMRWRERVYVLDGDVGLAYGPEMCASIGSALHASLAVGAHPGALTALSVEARSAFALSRLQVRYPPSRAG